jgi:large subunit ribosomal protein L21e
MVIRSHGPRVHTRCKLKRSRRERGLSPITHTLRSFEIGTKVVIMIDPSIHKGMPHPRFHGSVGIVTGMQGRVFEVEVIDGKKKKIMLCGPEHINTLK